MVAHTHCHEKKLWMYWTHKYSKRFFMVHRIIIKSNWRVLFLGTKQYFTKSLKHMYILSVQSVQYIRLNDTYITEMGYTFHKNRHWFIQSYFFSALSIISVWKCQQQKNITWMGFVIQFHVKHKKNSKLLTNLSLKFW